MKKILSLAALTTFATLLSIASPLASADVVFVPGGGPSGPPRGYRPAPAAPHPGYRPAPPAYYPGPPAYHPGPPAYYPPGVPAPRPHAGGGGGEGVAVPGGGRLHTPPAYGNQPAERDVVDLITRSIEGLGCERLGEAVRNLSNNLLANVAFATRQDPRAHAPPMLMRPARPMTREQFIQQWLHHLNNPELMQKLWGRLAEIYRSCNRECFDDGVAIGQLSGAGYCGGSVGAGGLSGVGAISQPPLPLCENTVFAGCQQGYYAAVQQYEGCGPYVSGNYDRVLRDFISQDCHIDQP